MYTLGLNWRVIECGTSAFQERTHIIRQPEGGKDRRHRPGKLVRKVIFGDHQRDVFRHTVVSPHLQDVLHQPRLAIQRRPRDLARLERVVFKRNEGEIGKTVVRFQVGDETAHP